MADKKMDGVGLNEEDAAQLRYDRGKEEAKAALVEYINTGETIDEDEVERFIAQKLKSKDIEV